MKDEVLIDGRYKLKQLIGSGGMGNVFLAQDLDLDRQVAIKLLQFSDSMTEDDLEQFRVEIQALADLKHPSIVRLIEYGGLDSTESDTPPYLIMSLMYTSLRDILNRYAGRPLAFRTVLYIVERVGEALKYAHHQKIFHRDLKPENILLNTEGYPFLADFGLAHYWGESSQINSGAGTLRYMSPEQIMAKGVDYKSDIYSLGAILYELLSGQVPFYHKEATYQIQQAHIMDDRPKIENVRIDQPVNINEIIAKCMARDPQDRYQSIEEMIRELKQRSPVRAASIHRPIPPLFPETAGLAGIYNWFSYKRNLYRVATVGAILFCIGLFGFLQLRTGNFSTIEQVDEVVAAGPVEIEPAATESEAESTPTPLLTATDIIPPTETPEPSPLPTEDPQSADLIGTPSLFIRAVDWSETAILEQGGDITRIPSSGLLPLFTDVTLMVRSSDSNFDFIYTDDLHYRTGPQGTLSIADDRIELIDGLFLIDAEGGLSDKAWIDRFQLVIAQGAVGIQMSGVSKIVTLDCLTGSCELREEESALISLEPGERVTLDLDKLEEGIIVEGFETEIYEGLFPNTLRQLEQAIPTPTEPAPTVAVATIRSDEPSGHIIYTCPVSGIDQVCRINPATELRTQLTRNDGTSFYASPDPTGRLVTYSRQSGNRFLLYEADVLGVETEPIDLPLAVENGFAPEISPDGTKLVYAITNAVGHIFVYDFITGENVQITSGDHIDQDPTWFPDGERIAFVSDRTGEKRHYIINADGSGIKLVETELVNIGGRSDVSPDGKWLAIFAGPGSRRDIHLISLEGDEVLTLTDAGENISPAFSPDGQWIVYASRERVSQDLELYIVRLDGYGLTRLTANATNDYQPRWGP